MRVLIASLAIAALAGCATPITEPAPAAPPASAETALAAYYATLSDADLPRAPAGQSLPAGDAVLTRILVGSCNKEELESPVLARIADEPADLFLMIGDNVYGDMDGRRYITFDPDLNEMKASFSQLAARAEFQAVRAAHPMMVTWDDHDFGANDAGADFPFRTYAERIHEAFWGLTEEDVGAWPGVYYARSFGPEGRRVQIIMLDTRFFRSQLAGTYDWGARGKERYVPLPLDAEQKMLGNDQWTWLENQLHEPADIRFIVSSIQILTTDGHGFEHWANMPAERNRLMSLIDSTGAEGVVFVSGDRHASFLYRSEDSLDYTVHEITASSLNASFRDETEEMDSRQIGAGYSKVNFGSIEIDWEAEALALRIHDEEGRAVRETRFPIPRRNRPAGANVAP